MLVSIKNGEEMLFGKLIQITPAWQNLPPIYSVLVDGEIIYKYATSCKILGKLNS
jgi:hypothetical protein